MKRTALIASLAAGAIAQKGQQPNPAPVPLGPKPAGCSKFEVLVARGTSEPGPYGFIVGDPLIGNITKAMPDARGYAVQYPADLTDASVGTGAKDVVERLNSQAKACPEQKFALVGYSQGGIVMHQAAAKIPEPMQNEKIMALVMFGDPGLNSGKAKALPQVLAKKLWENCAVGDPVCTTGKELAPHLSYSAYGTRYQEDSMKFIMAAFDGKPMPARPMAPLPGEGPNGPAAPGAPKESGAPKDPAPKDPAPKDPGAPKMSSMMSMSAAPKETAPKDPAPKDTGMPKMSSMMTMSMSMAPKETGKGTAKESATMPKMSMSMSMSMAPGETMSAGVPAPMPKSSDMSMPMPKSTAEMSMPMPMPKSTEMPPGMTMTMTGMTMSGMPTEATATPAVQTAGASTASGSSSLLAAFGLALLALFA